MSPVSEGDLTVYCKPKLRAWTLSLIPLSLTLHHPKHTLTIHSISSHCHQLIPANIIPCLDFYNNLLTGTSPSTMFPPTETTGVFLEHKSECVTLLLKSLFRILTALRIKSKLCTGWQGPSWWRPHFPLSKISPIIAQQTECTMLAFSVPSA